MRSVRVAAVLTAAAVLSAVPVVSPAWAAPHPVAPTVHRTPLAGVDDGALKGAPPALSPVATLDATARQGSGAGPDSTSGRAGTAAPRAAQSSRPVLFTTPLETGAFTAVGVTWRRSPSAVAVQVRVRENGKWSDWQFLHEEGGPDAGTAEARSATSTVATEPYTSASADAVQVRLDSSASTAPAEVNLVTVDAGRSAADGNLQQTPAGTAHGAARQPAVVSRAAWGADESIRTCVPSSSSTVKVGFVHHTDGSNTYQPGDSAGLVRGIYAYHVQANGWCDIGYNFLVDRYGTVFEGRYGGIDKAIIGAHTLAFNRDSFGVAAMGSFMTAAAPSAMTTSLASVLGWKLSLFAGDPTGTTQLTSAGGTGARWPAGTVVPFAVVSGHRDAYNTDCPGDVIYGQLSTLRTAATRYLLTTSTPVQRIEPDASLTSPNGQYRLVMQPDGNLVVYDAGGSARWASRTAAPYSRAVVQGDGNVVIRDPVDGSARWSSNTSGLSARLVMQDDGNVVLYTAAGAQWDSQGYAQHPTTLYPPVRTRVPSLSPGASVASPSGSYRLVMQEDGNLVEYTPSGTARWATATFVPGARLEVQTDGNLVIYTPDNRALWSSGTFDRPGAFGLIADDGYVSIYGTDITLLWRA